MSLPVQHSTCISVDNMDCDQTIYRKNEEEEEVIVNQKKIGEVPENERIKLDNDTIYHFSCAIDNNYLVLTLNEIGAFAPYIYRCLLSLEEIQAKYKMFRSCDTLDQVKEHIDRLFNDKKIKLSKDDDVITFNLSVYEISELKVITIEARKIMTTKKDDALMKLYQIEKDQIKILKEIEKFAINKGTNGNNIIAKLKEVMEKYK